MIKTLTQKNSVDISLESINNNGKKNACKERERAAATNTTEINKDMCDIQNKIVADRIKNDAKKFDGNLTNFAITCRKT